MSPDAFTELKKGSAETLVLAVLEDGPRHGYELAKEIDRRSAGRLVFHVATLYTTLYRMENDGLIAGRWVEKSGQRRKRFYRITPVGRKRLAAARQNWLDFVNAIDGVVLKPVS
jgi:DNA-binding PadR family transcriptional regulator